MSLFGSIFGQSDKHISDPRAREREMVAMLQAIDLDDPHRGLSDRKLRELKLPAVIEDAIRDLRYPLVVDQDLSQLDRDLTCIISALDQAVKHGRELTAQWASYALTFAIRNLRTEIHDMDTDLTAETLRCRLEYSRNLKLLVELCTEHDLLTASLAQRRSHRQEKRRELDTAKARYQSRRDSGELELPLNELKLHIHNPAALSDEARDLRDELSKLHLLKSAVIELDVAIDADKLSLNTCSAQIDSRRNALASAPRARDPKLQERINEADRLYREQLRKDLNAAEEAIRAYDRHTDAMADLAGHSVHMANIAKALEERKQLELERLRQQLHESQT